MEKKTLCLWGPGPERVNRTLVSPAARLFLMQQCLGDQGWLSVVILSSITCSGDQATACEPHWEDFSQNKACDISRDLSLGSEKMQQEVIGICAECKNPAASTHLPCPLSLRNSPVLGAGGGWHIACCTATQGHSAKEQDQGCAAGCFYRAFEHHLLPRPSFYCNRVCSGSLRDFWVSPFPSLLLLGNKPSPRSSK